ncbi:hypothetical protein KFV02_10990 [Desulfohalobiaceae bacterium Ax17]|jgi:hypothetical protein|uniref:hypothetical protein n=1 Tax=Desulfovulcanus ferrireducens TaxID=2831190 RepID=UPI00207BBEC0|nr:hypothetical protein [Desulfovulcanus ferrireducens]MBT8764459.1 hypothetical protein [Desulfovulcanus ferrireducens]
MSEEIKLELKKPLDKMTAKELRQLAMDKIPQITGASGMDKDELLAAIKEVLGISDDADDKTSPYKAQIRDLKRQIKELRAQKLALPKSKRAEREKLRRKIHNLKKLTRRLAAA